MVFVSNLLAKTSSILPFLAVIFYPFWNAKIYFVLNFITIASFIFFVFGLYYDGRIELVEGYKYLIYFFLIYLISFAFSPLRDIISAEYVNFFSGLIIFTLTVNLRHFDFRYYYPFFFSILLIFLIDNFFGLDFSLKGNTNLFSFIFMVIIGMFLENKNYYATIPFFIGILFTKSYSAILAIFLVSIIYLLRNTKMNEFQKDKPVYIFLLVLIFFIIMNIEPKSIYDRLSWWLAAIRIFYDRFLIGWGYSSFSHIFSAYYSGSLKTIYPHNFLLSILTEGGIFALLFFSIFLFKVISKIQGTSKYILFALLFHSFFDIGVDTTCGWWLFMFYLGFCFKKSSYIVFLNNIKPKFFYLIILTLFLLFFNFMKFSYSLIYIENTIEKSLHLLSSLRYTDAIQTINKAIEKYPSSIDLAKTRAFIYSKYYSVNDKAFLHYLSSLEYFLILNPYQKEIYQILSTYYGRIDRKLLEDLERRKRLYIKA